MYKKRKIGILAVILLAATLLASFLLLNKQGFGGNQLRYDPETRKYYSPGILFVTFKDSVSESAILEYLRERNLEILDKRPWVMGGPKFTIIRVPVGREKEYRDSLKKSPLVKNANLDYYVTQLLN